jgi:putative transposase
MKCRTNYNSTLASATSWPNAKPRNDILDANLFFSLEHVYDITKPWKEDYNQERPHEALNYCTSNEYEA